MIAMRNPIVRLLTGSLVLIILGTGLALPEAQAQAPRALEAASDGGAVKLAWDAPPLGGNVTIDAYRIYRDDVSIPNGDPEDTDAELIARIDTPDGNPATSYTDTDVALGSTYYYRATAVYREPGDDADESNFSNEASTTLPPAITLTDPDLPNPDPQPAGTSITVEAELFSDIGLRSATLHVRPGGAPAFTELSQQLSATEVDYEQTISSNNVTARGVEFFLTATDADGATTRVPASGFVFVPVTANTLITTLPGGTTQSAFRMIAFPTSLESNRLSALLEDDLGPLDPKQWRLFRIGPSGLTGSGDGYEEVQTLTESAQPGTAFWIIARTTTTLDIGPGTSLRTDQPFFIPLQAGWNLISNPFAFDLPLENVTVGEEATPLNDILRYDGEFVPLESGDALVPFEGYLVRLPDGESGTLELNAHRPDNSAASSNQAAPLDWAISIEARVQQARDRYNTAAVSPTARAGSDRLDRFEPPPIGSYVSLYFPASDGDGLDGAYRRDVRPPSSPPHIWSFAVRTPIRDAVKLTFGGLDRLPAGWTAHLVDEQLDVVQPLPDQPRYRFNARPDAIPASFRLIVGPEAAVERTIDDGIDAPRRVRLFANYPNPFTPSTTIRYALPEAMPVTLRVYDALGRRVTTLRRGQRQSAGYHTVVWEGHSAKGQPVASGTYFYRLDAGGTTQTRQMVLVR